VMSRCGDIQLRHCEHEPSNMPSQVCQRWSCHMCCKHFN
jgi:hypothetical protein